MITTARKPALVIVETAPTTTPQHKGRDATQAEEMLLQIVPELIEAEAMVRRLRALMDEQTRLLARDRGLWFIRPEQVVQEFGA